MLFQSGDYNLKYKKAIGYSTTHTRELTDIRSSKELQDTLQES